MVWRISINLQKGRSARILEKTPHNSIPISSDFEAIHLKVIDFSFVVYVDEKNDNIIQPIPFSEKS